MSYRESMPAENGLGNLPGMPMTRRGFHDCSRRLGVALLGMISAASLLAAEPDQSDAHRHEPLAVSAELAWPELVDRTLANYPRFVELAARDAQARALVARAGNWLSAQPALSVRYQTDKPWDDVSLREYELGLELPLWRPGQRQAAQSYGQAATAGSRAAPAALRHDVAGILRTVLWDIERATNVLAVARDGALVAAELLRVVESRYEAGDLPLSETMLMRSTMLEREAAVIEAEALLVDSERAYRSLTGLDVRPSSFAEPLTERSEFDFSHPWVMLADAELEQARAAVDLTSRAAKGAPTLTIGPRRERASFSDYSADSLGISVAIPFGGKAHRTPAIAAAARELAQAEADRLQLLRQLDLDLHEARHTLLVVESSLELARRRSEIADSSFAMSQRAFADGEMSLLELLRREETALLTAREVAGLEVERQRAIARINQAVGVLP